MFLKRGAITILVLALALSLGAAGCGSSGQMCQDECAQGDQRCAGGANGYEVCGDFDEDTCLEWGGLVDCTGGTTCSEGACGSVHTGMVLTGELVPAGGVSAASGLQLHGALTRGPGGPPGRSGSLTLEHVGFTSR